MARMKGAELITEYLIKNKIPYVFGICGHGNVGMLDPLYHARDRIKMISPRHEQVAAHMADCLFPRAPRAGRDADLVRSGLLQHRHAAAGGDVGFLGDPRHHGQRADPAVQPQPVPGDQQALPGGLPQHHPPGGQAQLPADPRRHAAADAAAGDDDHAVGPARSREHRRAVQRLPGGGRRRNAAGRARARHQAQRRLAGRDQRRARHAAEGQAPGDLHRPRRHAGRGRQGADRVRARSSAFRSSPRPTAWAAST